MNNETTLSLATATADTLPAELASLNLFNEFDLQILQLQSEIEYRLAERQKCSDHYKYKFEAQLKEFSERWFEEVEEAASLPLKSLEHDISVYAYGREDSMISVRNGKSSITFSYLMNNYEFVMERCDEFEDIDVHDFVLRWYRLDKDELMKINIAFAELESLIPFLVRWNREMEAMHSDIRVGVMQANFELKAMDDELKEMRKKIHAIRSASFMAGNVVDFGSMGVSRLYTTKRKFEFVDQIKLIGLSATGKTCSFEAIVLDKAFRSTYYYPDLGTAKVRVIQKVRVSSLLSNLYERK